MASTYTVLLSELASEFKLDFFYRSTDFDKIHVTVDDISRPGLHLAGFFDHYEPMRVYVCGTVETAYLQKLTPEERIIIFDHFLSYKCPALIFARGFEPMPECLEMAKKYDVTVLGTKDTTSYIVSSLITYLKSALAPRITRHGVLVEVSGEGVLILGDSGVGKSETALELIKRGHRLIADDAVEIRRVSSRTLVGSAPDNIRHFIELRGVGIINARRIFGMGAVKMTEKIDMVVQLEPWDNEKVYDRLGLDNEYVEILGINIPLTVVPVKPGRNLSIIIEAAAMNNRQKKMGYNAARELLHSLGMTDDIVPEKKELEVWHDF